MRTFEFKTDEWCDVYRLVGNEPVCFCVNDTPFDIPESATRVWVEIRKSPARGYLKAQFVKMDGGWWDLKIGNRIFTTTLGLDRYARDSNYFKLNQPFYFCMYYE